MIILFLKKNYDNNYNDKKDVKLRTVFFLLQLTRETVNEILAKFLYGYFNIFKKMYLFCYNFPQILIKLLLFVDKSFCKYVFEFVWVNKFVP